MKCRREEVLARHRHAYEGGAEEVQGTQGASLPHAGRRLWMRPPCAAGTRGPALSLQTGMAGTAQAAIADSHSTDNGCGQAWQARHRQRLRTVTAQTMAVDRRGTAQATAADRHGTGNGCGQARHRQRLWTGGVRHRQRLWTGAARHRQRLWTGGVRHRQRLWTGVVARNRQLLRTGSARQGRAGLGGSEVSERQRTRLSRQAQGASLKKSKPSRGDSGPSVGPKDARSGSRLGR